MQLVGVGDNVVDRYRDLGMMFPGGQALNVAVHAKRAGMETAYVGAVDVEASDDLANWRPVGHGPIANLTAGGARLLSNEIEIDAPRSPYLRVTPAAPAPPFAFTGIAVQPAQQREAVPRMLAQVAGAAVADVPGAFDYDLGDDTAVFATGDGTSVAFANSIVAGSCVAFNAAVVDSEGGNIESAGDTCGFGLASDHPGVSSISLGLGSLADHGGPTRTRVASPLLIGMVSV